MLRDVLSQVGHIYEHLKAQDKRTDGLESRVDANEKEAAHAQQDANTSKSRLDAAEQKQEQTDEKLDECLSLLKLKQYAPSDGAHASDSKWQRLDASENVRYSFATILKPARGYHVKYWRVAASSSKNEFACRICIEKMGRADKRSEVILKDKNGVDFDFDVGLLSANGTDVLIATDKEVCVAQSSSVSRLIVFVSRTGRELKRVRVKSGLYKNLSLRHAMFRVLRPNGKLRKDVGVVVKMTDVPLNFKNDLIKDLKEEDLVNPCVYALNIETKNKKNGTKNLYLVYIGMSCKNHWSRGKSHWTQIKNEYTQKWKDQMDGLEGKLRICILCSTIMAPAVEYFLLSSHNYLLNKQYNEGIKCTYKNASVAGVEFEKFVPSLQDLCRSILDVVGRVNLAHAGRGDL